MILEVPYLVYGSKIEMKLIFRLLRKITVKLWQMYDYRKITVNASIYDVNTRE